MLESLDLEVSIFESFTFKHLENKLEYVIENYSVLKERLVAKRDYLRSMINKEVYHVRKILGMV